MSNANRWCITFYAIDGALNFMLRTLQEMHSLPTPYSLLPTPCSLFPVPYY
ncbi:MAG: hypothetical protein F6K55_04685 [Moorea sp. SIO4A3]|nr:hypothetical protein [Moorena sp. SIO4A3]